jgi:DNA-binding MarR family transcriptional regulator
MARHRLSHLQRRTLAWLAQEESRTPGTITVDHRDLARALGHDKSNLSDSLANLEAKSLVTLARTPGGHVAAIDLTPAGRQVAVSCE